MLKLTKFLYEREGSVKFMWSSSNFSEYIRECMWIWWRPLTN